MLRYRYNKRRINESITDDELDQMITDADFEQIKQFCNDNSPDYDVIELGTEKFDEFLCKCIKEDGGYETLTSSWIRKLNLGSSYQKDAFIVKDGKIVGVYKDEDDAYEELVCMIIEDYGDINKLDISALQ